MTPPGRPRKQAVDIPTVLKDATFDNDTLKNLGLETAPACLGGSSELFRVVYDSDERLECLMNREPGSFDELIGEISEAIRKSQLPSTYLTDLNIIVGITAFKPFIRFGIHALPGVTVILRIDDPEKKGNVVIFARK